MENGINVCYPLAVGVRPRREAATLVHLQDPRLKYFSQLGGLGTELSRRLLT